MKSSHKQDKYILEQAYVNLREKVNPYVIIDKIRKSKDGTLNDILGGALNTHDFERDTELFIQNIADEMDEAGYTSEVIKDITGIEVVEAAPNMSQYTSSSMDPEEVVENLKRLFSKHPEVERIYDTNMDAFGEITSDVVESIAEELREAGYSTGFILQNTGIDLSITHKGGYPDGIPGIIQDAAGDSPYKKREINLDHVYVYDDLKDCFGDNLDDSIDDLIEEMNFLISELREAKKREDKMELALRSRSM